MTPQTPRLTPIVVVTMTDDDDDEDEDDNGDHQYSNTVYDDPNFAGKYSSDKRSLIGSYILLMTNIPMMV